MSFLKKLASDSAIYGLNSILGRSINFLLVALHTSVFAPEEQSITIMLFSYATFLNVIYTYGMETTFFRFASNSNENLNKTYNQSQSALLISSIGLSLVIVIFSNSILKLVGGKPDQIQLVYWFAIILALDAIVAIPFARLRLENKAKKYVAIRLGSVFINVFLNVFFLWFCRKIYLGEMLPNLKPLISAIYNPALGVGYIVLANLIGNLIYIPTLWDELITKFKFAYDKVDFLKMWNYGYPLLILGLAGMVNQQIDRQMLYSYLPLGFYDGLNNDNNDAIIGIYGSCYKLSILISLATQSFRFAADPFFFSKAEDKNAPTVFAEVTKWFTIFCCILWVGICLNLDVLGQLFIKREIYRTGLGIVPLLLLGNLFLGIYYNLAVWFKLTDKTKYGTIITLFGAGINIILNYILIPKIGYLGCAWAFMISCFIMTALCYWLGEKHFPVPYNLKSIVGYLGISALLIWLNSFIKISNIWVAIGYHGLIFILFLLIIIVVERERILPKKLREKFGF
jgi:O-antigen/teichoic acid export membrane protein